MTPTYVEMPPDLPAMLRDADAALLIGDEAIRAYWEPPAGLHTYDLGTEWKAWTGLPMVYAVWAVRARVRRGATRRGARVADALNGSLAYCRGAPRRHHRVRRAVGAVPAPRSSAATSTRCSSASSPATARASTRYLAEAHDIGQLERVPDARVFGEQS